MFIFFGAINFLDFAASPARSAAAVALLAALLLVATQRWHGHLSMDGTEGVQKFHAQPTPRVGGVAVLLGLLVGYVLAAPGQKGLLGPLLLAGTPAIVFGLTEDLTKQVSVRTRLVATMACGVFGWVLTGLSITDANLFGLDWLLSCTVLSVAFTAFAGGGVANAINIIDGFNGLAAGTVIIILAGFGVAKKTTSHSASPAASGVENARSTWRRRLGNICPTAIPASLRDVIALSSTPGCPASRRSNSTPV